MRKRLFFIHLCSKSRKLKESLYNSPDISVFTRLKPTGSLFGFNNNNNNNKISCREQDMWKMRAKFRRNFRYFGLNAKQLCTFKYVARSTGRWHLYVQRTRACISCIVLRARNNNKYYMWTQIFSFDFNFFSSDYYFRVFFRKWTILESLMRQMLEGGWRTHTRPERNVRRMDRSLPHPSPFYSFQKNGTEEGNYFVECPVMIKLLFSLLYRLWGCRLIKSQLEFFQI